MQDELKDRTKKFSLRVIRLCEALPKGRTADVIGGQRCVAARLWGQITGQPAERDHPLSSSQRWGLLRKNVMKVCSGWS